MDPSRVADALEEIALLLDLLGENPFKSRAYQNAAGIIRGLDRDLEAVVASGSLREIRGIGEALADKISTLVVSGSLPYLDDLRAQVPPGLLDWLKVPGLGPKKARAIHRALGASTLDDLESACRLGRVRGLAGFGETSERKILQGIERIRLHAGRYLQPLARREAERLLEVIRASGAVIRSEIAGSVRRRAETSKDIDLVASSADPDRVMDAFVACPFVAEVTGRGPTKCSVRLVSGPSADLRIVPDDSFPFALAYFTGSKAHNVALRSRAQRMGLKLNEYGLFREADTQPVPCRDETEIHLALGLAWIPPELREDHGEIEAAAKGALPKLVDREDLRGILHCHSTWSDGTASIETMAEAAIGLGVSYLGLCDHSQAAAYARGLDRRRFESQWEEIDAINARLGGKLRVLKGVEVDVLPDGSLDLPDDALAGFDLVIASIHSRFQLSRQEQTERILRALDNRWVDMLGHPTGRLLLSRDPYEVDLHRVLAAAAQRGIAVEINAHPQRLDLDPAGLRFGLPLGLKTSINPDAHDPAGLADVSWGVGTARRGGCTAEDVLNAWPLERLLDHIARRRR